MMRSSVVLPQPDGPRSTIVSPALIVEVERLSARVPSGNVFAQRAIATHAALALAAGRVAPLHRRRSRARDEPLHRDQQRHDHQEEHDRVGASRSRGASRRSCRRGRRAASCVSGVCSIHVMLNSPIDSVTTISAPARMPERAFGHDHAEEALRESRRRGSPRLPRACARSIAAITASTERTMNGSVNSDVADEDEQPARAEARASSP